MNIRYPLRGSLSNTYPGIQFLHLSMLQPDKKNHSTEQCQQQNVSAGYLQLEYGKKRSHLGIG